MFFFYVQLSPGDEIKFFSPYLLALDVMGRLGDLLVCATSAGVLGASAGALLLAHADGDAPQVALGAVRRQSGLEGEEKSPNHYNIGIAMWTLSVAKLVVVGDGDRRLGCYKVFVSLICRLHSVSTPGKLLE